MVGTVNGLNRTFFLAALFIMQNIFLSQHSSSMHQFDHLTVLALYLSFIYMQSCNLSVLVKIIFSYFFFNVVFIEC